MIKIKSKYIINEILSFLSKKQILKMIIYNKQLQNILNINLNVYKEISDKFIILEENGEGKEYKLEGDILIFEGEYLNGKRNGKGKEYYDFNKKLSFEGKYLNGEKNGKGKEYDYGKLKFDGEYLNGKKWNGKGYNINGEVIYEINDGKGYIKEYDSDGKLVFEVDYLNGERNGKGKEYDYKGRSYLKENI